MRPEIVVVVGILRNCPGGMTEPEAQIFVEQLVLLAAVQTFDIAISQKTILEYIRLAAHVG